MQSILDIDIGNTIPLEKDVLKAQGIPSDIEPDTRIIELARKSLEIYDELADPIAIVKEITMDRFENIYSGNGKNETETPLEEIYKVADKLALFAVSIGDHICCEISRLFEQNNFALAAMLDSAASEGVENAAVYIEKTYAYSFYNIENPSSEVVTRFSPGYCGWHISGQKKLFDILNPETIGIYLKKSFLMEPIKSISGVLVAGKKKIFDFNDDYIFCADCADHSCRSRVFSIPGSGQ